MPKLITKTIHAYLDYPVALGLMIMPYILGIGDVNPLAFWVSVATGAAAFILTVLTDHHLGVIKILPFKLHLAVDLLVGIAFIAVPFILGLNGLEAAYFWVLGATVLVVVSMNSPEDAMATARG